MTSIRAYLPVGSDDVRSLVDEGALPPGPPRRAYAVSPALVERTPRADREEREHVAFLSAVAGAAAHAGMTRRVILAMDADVDQVAWMDGDDAAADVSGAIARRAVVSFHVDEEPGGADADLLWFDATEAAAVLGLLTGHDPS